MTLATYISIAERWAAPRDSRGRRRRQSYTRPVARPASGSTAPVLVDLPSIISLRGTLTTAPVGEKRRPATQGNRIAPSRPSAAVDMSPARESRIATTPPARKPSAAYLAGLKRIAADYSVNADDLDSTAEQFYLDTREQFEAREYAKQAARALTGLTSRDISRLENSGLDHACGPAAGGVTGQKLRHFDAMAQEAARQLPELGLGDPDDPTENFAARLWSILSEGKQRLPARYDENILTQAARYLSNLAGFDTQPPGGLSGDLASVPF